MMPLQNPYAPPKSAESGMLGGGDWHDVRSVVVAWEKLRIIYNIVLFFLGIPVMAMWGSPMMVIPGAIMVGIGANLSYFAGPVVELYSMAVRRKGAWNKGPRLALFSAGLGFSVLLFALAAVVSP